MDYWKVRDRNSGTSRYLDLTAGSLLYFANFAYIKKEKRGGPCLYQQIIGPFGGFVQSGLFWLAVIPDGIVWFPDAIGLLSLK